MKKFPKSLVLNYIRGENLGYYDALDLENQKEFMQEVLSITKDYHMFYLCSDKLKNCHEFIKFTINLFKDEKDFIVEIAKKYLSLTNNMNNAHEINILMYQILKEKYKNSEEYLHYNLKTNNIFGYKMLEIEKLKEAISIDIGIGFEAILIEYENYPVFKEFYAEKMIYKIFFQNEDLSFEEIIHNNFKNISELDNAKLNTFFIDYIGNYDESLKEYVVFNMKLIESLKDNLIYVKKNWNNFIRTNKKIKISLFYEKVNEYYENNQDNILYGSEIIDYAIIKTNLNEIFEIEKTTSNIDIKELNINELKYLKYCINLLKQLFKNDYTNIDENDNHLIEKTNNKCRIVYYDFKNKKKVN